MSTAETGPAGRVFSCLLVDDHPLFRLGFASAWKRARPHDPLIEVAGVRDALEQLSQVDLAVVDVFLPDGLGFSVLERAREQVLPAVMLTSSDAPALVEVGRRLGARAFLSKDQDPGGIVVTLSRVLADEAFREFPDVARMPELSPRERDVLAGLLRGLTNREIADWLGIGAETVKSHVGYILALLGARDRAGAVNAARDLAIDIVLPWLGDRSTGSSL